MARPVTTLFMLMSLDGKISTGPGDERDVDRDFPLIDGVREGLARYYELEAETDAVSFNTGRVMAKVGWNDERAEIARLPVSFVVVDNRPHLTRRGVENLVRSSERLCVVTTCADHPALAMDDERLSIISYPESIDFVDLFERLGSSGVARLTIQSGGEMNAHLLRQGLIDMVSVVVAPALVGGRTTPSLIDGDGLATAADLQQIRALELVEVRDLGDSYLQLTYHVAG